MGDRIHIHTHTCVRHYKSRRGSGRHTHTHAHTHTHMHATGADKNDAQKKLTHTDKYTLNTLRALTSKASRWAGLFFSPPLSRTHRAPGWRRGPSVSQHCPLPRSLFLGMAALSSWLGWSSLYADSKPLAVWSCQEFIILHGGSFPPSLTNESMNHIFFFFYFRHKNSRKNSANVVWKQTTSGHAGIHNGKNFKVNSVQFNGTEAISGFIVRLR